MSTSIFSQEEYERRITSVRAEMQQHGFDCLYLPYGQNQYYLTGLNAQPTAQAASRVLAALVPIEGDIMFVAPSRRRKLVERMSWVQDIRTWTFPENPANAVREALNDLGVEDGVIGIDSVTPFEEVDSIQRLLPNARFCSCSSIFQKTRLIKSDEEIAQLRKAGEIADKSLKEGLALLKEGATEAEIAAAIYSSILYDGGDISHVAVIAGKHPGFPEKTGKRRVQQRQLVLIFPKFSYNGYFVDITRMAVLDGLSSEEETIEKAIQESYEAAVAVARPGVTYDEVDRAGRTVLDRYGLAKFFTHGIGHGLGMATHEPPYIGTNTIFEAGMVFSIEPSVYRPGQPAMRVEDTFVVTNDGCERLTSLPITVFST